MVACRVAARAFHQHHDPAGPFLPDSYDTPADWRGQPAGFWWRFVLAGLMVMLINGTGAIISLGDLLIRELGQNYDGLVQLLYQMRPAHPAIAIGAGLVVIWLTFDKLMTPWSAPRRWAWICVGLVVAQWAVGLLNVWLNVPLWTSIAHLLLADGIWPSLIWFATALERTATVRELRLRRPRSAGRLALNPPFPTTQKARPKYLGAPFSFGQERGCLSSAPSGWLRQARSCRRWSP